MSSSVSTPSKTPSPALRSFVVAGKRDPAVVDFETGVVDFFVDAAGLLGFPRSFAAIYGIVFASPTPLSFADIAARLDLSNGSVSQGLRALRAIGAVTEVSRPEDPAELFEPALEMRRLIKTYLEGRLEPQLQIGRSRLRALAQHVAQLSPGERRRIQPRLTKLQDWHRRTRALLPLIRTFLKL